MHRSGEDMVFDHLHLLKGGGSQDWLPHMAVLTGVSTNKSVDGSTSEIFRLQT